MNDLMKKWWIWLIIFFALVLLVWSVWGAYSAASARIAKAERIAEEAKVEQEKMAKTRTAFESEYKLKVKSLEGSLVTLAKEREEFKKKLAKQDELIAGLYKAKQEVMSHVYSKTELDSKFTDILKRGIR